MAWQPDPVDPGYDMYARVRENAPFLVDYAVVWHVFCPKIIGLPSQEYGELRMGFSYGMRQFGCSFHNAAVQGSECDMNYRFRIAGRIMSTLGQTPNPSLLNIHVSQFLPGDRYKNIFRTDINMCDFMCFNEMGQVHDEGWLPVTFAESKFKLSTGNIYLIVEGQLGQAEVFRNNHLVYSWDCTTGKPVDLNLLRGQIPLNDLRRLMKVTTPMRDANDPVRREKRLLEAKNQAPTTSTLEATRVNANPEVKRIELGVSSGRSVRSFSLTATRTPRPETAERTERARSLSYASRPHITLSTPYRSGTPGISTPYYFANTPTPMAMATAAPQYAMPTAISAPNPFTATSTPIVSSLPFTTPATTSVVPAQYYTSAMQSIPTTSYYITPAQYVHPSAAVGGFATTNLYATSSAPTAPPASTTTYGTSTPGFVSSAVYRPL